MTTHALRVATRIRVLKCVVCEKPANDAFLCRPCGRSYDKSAEKDVTILGAIEWAAKRARWFATRRVSGGES